MICMVRYLSIYYIFSGHCHDVNIALNRKTGVEYALKILRQGFWKESERVSEWWQCPTRHEKVLELTLI